MRIAQYLGDSPWGDVTPETLEKTGMGGRETALVKLAESWRKLGHDVVNLVPVEKPFGVQNVDDFSNATSGSSTYASSEITSDYLSNFQSDVVVSWEEPKVFAAPRIRENTKLAVIEMQVAHLAVDMPEYGINCDEFIDGYASLSNWAKDFLIFNEPAITKDKVVVLPNGVDISRFDSFQELGYKNKAPYFKFFYSSSPDRGLHHLLRIWPRIREKWPQAELYIAYGVENWANHARWMHNRQAEVALEVEEGLSQDGVVYLGKIGQDDLTQVQLRCDALLYTCDTLQPTETGCITAIEAMAAGAVPVLTECDCLPSEFRDQAVFSSLPFNDDEYLDNLFALMEEGDRYEALQDNGAMFAATRDWDVIAEEWIKWFQAKLN